MEAVPYIFLYNYGSGSKKEIEGDLLMKKLALVLIILIICFSFSSSILAQTIELEFFQNKREAVATFDKLIEKFESENPKIKIEQNHVPDAETVLKSRLARNRIPDIMGLGGNFTYGQIADAGILMNFDQASYLDLTQAAYRKMLKDLQKMRLIMAFHIQQMQIQFYIIKINLLNLV